MMLRWTSFLGHHSSFAFSPRFTSDHDLLDEQIPYRDLDTLVVPISYPMPRIAESLN
jgi:hypothetical protein